MGAWKKRIHNKELLTYVKEASCEECQLCFEIGKYKAYLLKDGTFTIHGFRFIIPQTEKCQWLHHIPYIGPIDNLTEKIDALKEGMRFLCKRCPDVTQVNLYDDAMIPGTAISWSAYYLLFYGKPWCMYELGGEPYHFYKKKEIDEYYKKWKQSNMRHRVEQTYLEHGLKGLLCYISEIPKGLLGMSWHVSKDKLQEFDIQLAQLTIT